MQDPSQNMNPPPVVMHHGQPPHAMVSQPQLLSGPPPQLLGQPQHTQMMGQVPMLNRGYLPWLQQGQQLPPMDPNKFHGPMNLGFGASMAGRSNWKGKNVNDKRQGPRKVQSSMPSTGAAMGGYNPPSLRDLQSQNRQQARKYYPKKKFYNQFAPYAPRNTTSFLIRAKKSGGIASLVSPCPVTPTVLPTPVFSPSREVLVDMAKEEWGVDGYGSMKGLIRLRDDDVDEHDHDHEDENESSESDVEEDNNVLSRLDHEMSRFEMVYPTHGVDYNLALENRVHDQDAHISQLEEENLTLKESLFLMEREVEDMRRRLQVLERRNRANEDVENVSECESEGGSYVNGMGGVESKEELMDDFAGGDLASLNTEVDSDAKLTKPNTHAEEQEGNKLQVDDYFVGGDLASLNSDAKLTKPDTRAEEQEGNKLQVKDNFVCGDLSSLNAEVDSDAKLTKPDTRAEEQEGNKLQVKGNFVGGDLAIFNAEVDSDAKLTKPNTRAEEQEGNKLQVRYQNL